MSERTYASQAEYDDELLPVPRTLIESAIDALHEQAENASHWKGIRNWRIDDPLRDARALRDIAGPVENHMNPEERAEGDARMQAWMVEHGITPAPDQD